MATKRKKQARKPARKPAPKVAPPPTIDIDEVRRQAIAETSRKHEDARQRELLTNFVGIISQLALPDTHCLTGVQKIGNELHGWSVPVGELKEIARAVNYLLARPRNTDGAPF